MLFEQRERLALVGGGVVLALAQPGHLKLREHLLDRAEAHLALLVAAVAAAAGDQPDGGRARADEAPSSSAAVRPAARLSSPT